MDDVRVTVQQRGVEFRRRRYEREGGIYGDTYWMAKGGMQEEAGEKGKWETPPLSWVINDVVLLNL